MLRRHSGESLLDLVRLIIDTTGIDVELSSSTSEAAAARRDNLDLFVKAVAEFQAIDGDHVARFAAGLPRGRGRARHRPRRRHPDRGRLGQAADGPPRQGPRVGRGVPGRGQREASSRPSARAACGPRWAGCCPPPLRGDARRPAAARRARPEPGSTTSSSAAVTTRPSRSCGSATSPSPGPATCSASPPTGASTAARRSGPPATSWPCVEAMAGERPDARRRWTAEPEVARARGDRARARSRGRSPSTPREALRRLEAAELVREADPSADDDGLDLASLAEVQAWDDEIERLLAEARADRADVVDVPLPVEPLGHRAGPAARRPRRASPATWPGRCRGRRRRRPGSAPASTPGSRRGSASSS